MKSLFPPFIIVLLALLQASFVVAYIAHEHTIYFWDHAMYHNMARLMEIAFRNGWEQALFLLRRSFGQDYNYIFTFPSLLSFPLFGNSRAVFIVTNFLFFFLLYEAAVAFVLRKVFSLSWPKSLFLSLLCCSFVPPLWLPLLEGYPDIGAAACIAWALGVLLNRNMKYRDALIIGVLLGFAVLLRRHFAYAVVVLLSVAFFFRLAEFVLSKNKIFNIALLERLLFFFALSLGSMVFTIAIIAPEFLVNALTVNYSSLYSSYRRSTTYILLFILGGFGWLLLCSAVCGVSFASFSFPNVKKPFLFLSSVVLLWLVIWCIGPAQAGHHYILHFLPLFIVVGLASLFILANKKFSLRNAFFFQGVLVFLLILNSSWALWLSPTGSKPNDNGKPRFFSSPRPPVVRTDFEELKKLALYLEKTTKAEDKILVIGSSFVFNQDLLRAVFVDVRENSEFLNRFIFAPEIDSRGVLPFEAFSLASVFLVPSSPQYHLDPSSQKVISAMARQFPPPDSRSKLFRKDDINFILEDSVALNIWRRPHPWPQGALQEVFNEMRKVLESSG